MSIAAKAGVEKTVNDKANAAAASFYGHGSPLVFYILCVSCATGVSELSAQVA
jgi:hypothetical protein